jgi:lipoyl(octanoyl) transferase
MRSEDLGLISYREAWALQERAHGQVLEGGEERVFLLEHRPVITLGRRVADSMKSLVTPVEQLSKMGVELVESDRGGDITFHGPGQLVAYPIVRLGERKLLAGGYVHRLEDVVIATLGEFGVEGVKDASAPGVWVDAGGKAAKICALGVRIKRGVSLHGIALNVTVDLGYFNLINPCGLSRPVTSVERVMGERAPSMAEVKGVFARRFVEVFG